MSTILNFGKYRGKTIEDVYELNPSYCRWINNQNLYTSDPEIRKFLDSKFKNSADGSSILTYGKYKGRSIKQVKQIDPNYLEWLKKSKFVAETLPKLVDEINNLS